jgi:hypothetical protein
VREAVERDLPGKEPLLYMKSDELASGFEAKHAFLKVKHWSAFAAFAAFTAFTVHFNDGNDMFLRVCYLDRVMLDRFRSNTCPRAGGKLLDIDRNS